MPQFIMYILQVVQALSRGKSVRRGWSGGGDWKYGMDG